MVEGWQFKRKVSYPAAVSVKLVFPVFAIMPSSSSTSIAQRQLANVRAELKNGKTRSRGGGCAHTPEEITALLKKEEALLQKRAEEKRQKIIQPINAHVTEDGERTRARQTSEAHGTKDVLIQALSLATGKNVSSLIMLDDDDKLKKDPKGKIGINNASL